MIVATRRDVTHVYASPATPRNETRRPTHRRLSWQAAHLSAYIGTMPQCLSFLFSASLATLRFTRHPMTHLRSSSQASHRGVTCALRRHATQRWQRFVTLRNDTLVRSPHHRPHIATHNDVTQRCPSLASPRYVSHSSSTPRLPHQGYAGFTALRMALHGRAHPGFASLASHLPSASSRQGDLRLRPSSSPFSEKVIWSTKSNRPPIA